MWAPKAIGACDCTSRRAGRELDWWVGFSSTSSLLGAPGQGAYACASAWLDALVDWRRASGLPATTINWGQWSDVGVARSPDVQRAGSDLAGRRHRGAGGHAGQPTPPTSAWPGCGWTGPRPHSRRFSNSATSPSWSRNWTSTATTTTGRAPTRCARWTPPKSTGSSSARLSGRILAIMGYPKGSTLDADQPLTELGMDSLMAVRIRNTVRGDFGVEPPVALLLQGASLADADDRPDPSTGPRGRGQG